MRRRFDDRTADRHVLGKANLSTRLCLGPNCLHGHSMAEHAMVPGLIKRSRRQAQPRCVNADSISQLYECSEFVDGKEMLDPVGEPLGDIPCIVGKRRRCVAGLPSSYLVLERLRQVPVIQGREWLDAICNKFVDQSIIEVQPFWIWGTSSVGKNSRPGDRESIALDAQPLH